MWTTNNQNEFADALIAFSKAARENYGSHAFEAGYLQSLAVSMLAKMPKREQKALIGDIERSTARQLNRIADMKEIGQLREMEY